MKALNFLFFIVCLFLVSCNSTQEIRDMPIPKNLDQASVQVRSVIVGLREANINMLKSNRYSSARGQAIKGFLDCVKDQMNSLLWFKGSIQEPEKLLEAQNMLNLLLLIETQKFRGSYDVGEGCRLSG